MPGAGSGVSRRQYLAPTGKMPSQGSGVFVINIQDAGYAKTAFFGD